jgi:hypothetical protein
MGLSWALRWDAVRPPLTQDRDGTGLDIIAFHLDRTPEDTETIVKEYSAEASPMTPEAAVFFW